MNRSTDLRSFLPGMYPVAALLVIAPLVELVGLGWPLRPTETAWRFGYIGLGFGTMVVQILGLALAMSTAAALAHRRTLRFLALITLAVATIIIVGMARFLLDYGQLRGAIPAAERTGFDSSTFRALVSATLAVPVLLALGARALAQTRPSATETPELDDREELASFVIPFPRRQPR